MSSNFLKFTVATAMSALLSGAAFADNGFYVTGGFNSTTLQHNLSRNTGATGAAEGPVGGPSITSVDQETGASFYVSGGYRFEAFEDSFLEIEAFYADETAETQNINGVIVSDIELTSSYGVDVHLGQKITDKFSVYGLVGIAQYEGDANLSYTFAAPTDSVSIEETGFVYGAGVEIGLTSNISTFGEVRITNDLEFDTPVDQGGVTSENDLDFTGIRTGLKYKF